MSDSKGAAIEKIRKILFACSRAMAPRPKDYDIILDEKGVNEAIDAILAILAQEVSKARIDELGGVKEHHDSIPVPWEVGTGPYIEGRLTQLERLG